MTDKFRSKNEQLLQILDKNIDEKTIKNITGILVSIEMEYMLNESGEKDIPKYRGIRLIRDVWVPSGYLKIITRDDYQIYNTGCLCGIYADEKHP